MTHECWGAFSDKLTEILGDEIGRLTWHRDAVKAHYEFTTNRIEGSLIGMFDRLYKDVRLVDHPEWDHVYSGVLDNGDYFTTVFAICTRRYEGNNGPDEQLAYHLASLRYSFKTKQWTEVPLDGPLPPTE